MASNIVSYRDLVLTNDSQTITFALAVHPAIYTQCEQNPSFTSRMFDVMERMFAHASTSGFVTLSCQAALDQSFQVLTALGVELAEAREASGHGVSITARESSTISTLPPQDPLSQDVDTGDQIETTSQQATSQTVSNSDDSEWRDEDVRLLANLRKEMGHLFTGANRKKKHGWQKLAEKIQQHGHNRSAEECDRKFRSLIQRHKIITDRRKKSGEGRNPWRHYNLINELFGDNPAVTPLSSFSTLTDSTSDVPTCSTISTPSVTSSPTTPTSTLNSGNTDVETPVAPRLKRKRPNDEPEFMSKYRAELAQMHRERMEIERRKLAALEDLVQLMKGNNN